MPAPSTQFATLWVDAPDAINTLDRKVGTGAVDRDLADRIAHLIQYGYVVLKGAISPDHADALVAEIDRVAESPEYYVARRARMAYTHPSRDIYDDPSFRIIDYHVNSSLARDAMFCPQVSSLLRACFEDDLNAFQCLTFRFGSQQAMHQDGAYVVVSEPLKFMASWIALEDVMEGNGELIYHAGSHKLDDFIFGEGSKSWNPAKHGQDAHREFMEHLAALRESTDMPLKSFLPSKGDALIWASDLVHGGAPLKNAGQTRQSIVTHYCPRTVKPKFSTFSGHYRERRHQDQCYYSARHFDLRRRGGSWLLDYLRPGHRLRPAFMGKESPDPEE